MQEIDGSIGEGGGQVLRTALSISCVLRKPVHITNIRAGRSKPGLAAQHLAVCNLLSEISGAQMQGATLGSTSLTFEPGEIKGGNYKFDIGTAGSCTLLLQAALPVLAHAREMSTLEITGGTHVFHSPTFEYFSEVFLPAVKKFGVHANATLQRAGFFPKGGGKVALEAEPSHLRGCTLLPEEYLETNYSIVSSALPPSVMQREVNALKKIFPQSSGMEQAVSAACPGNSVTVWRGACGASALGEIGKPAEKVAREACQSLSRELEAKAAVDSRLADQLLIYAVLAEGKSEFSAPAFTPHLHTNADVLRALTGRNIILGAERAITVL